MKIKSLPTAALALVAATVWLAGSSPAPAQVSINIGVPPPPPPVVVEHPWAAPYPGAVWIPGENEWIDGRWVWVGGYYGYPPYRGAVWVHGYYGHGHWHGGHWAHHR